MILVDLKSSSTAFSYREEALAWLPRLPVYLAQGNDGNMNDIMRHSVKITPLLTMFLWIFLLTIVEKNEGILPFARAYVNVNY